MVGVVSLVVTAGVTLWLLVELAPQRIGWGWIYPWVLTPYAVLSVLILKLGDRTRASRVASFLTGISVLIFGLWMYVDGQDPQGNPYWGFLVILGPVYVLLVGLFVYATTALVVRKLLVPK